MWRLLVFLSLVGCMDDEDGSVAFAPLGTYSVELNPILDGCTIQGLDASGLGTWSFAQVDDAMTLQILDEHGQQLDAVLGHHDFTGTRIAAYEQQLTLTGSVMFDASGCMYSYDASLTMTRVDERGGAVWLVGQIDYKPTTCTATVCSGQQSYQALYQPQ